MFSIKIIHLDKDLWHPGHELSITNHVSSINYACVDAFKYIEREFQFRPTVLRNADNHHMQLFHEQL